MTDRAHTKSGLWPFPLFLWYALASALVALVLAPQAIQAQTERDTPGVGQDGEAQSNPLFRIDHILVRGMGSSGLEARQKAMRFGQIQALRQVVQRLVPQDEWMQIPTPSEAAFETMINGLQVSGEKQSNTSYLGLMSLSFDERRLRQYLADHDIQLAQPAEKPVLLILAFADQSGISSVWDSDSPWHQAWQPSPLAGTVLPTSQAGGDIEDREVIAARNALTPTEADIEVLRQAYGADAVLYAQASEVTGRGEDVAIIDTKLSAFGKLPGPKTDTRRCERKPAEALKVFYRRCAKDAASVYLKAWQDANRRPAIAEEVMQPAPAQIQRLQVVALVTDTASFAYLQRLASAAPSVRGLGLLEIGPQGAIVNLDFTGPINIMVQELQAAGLAIYQSNGLVYLQFAGG